MYYIVEEECLSHPSGIREGVSLVVGGERRFVSFYATSC